MPHRLALHQPVFVSFAQAEVTLAGNDGFHKIQRRPLIEPILVAHGFHIECGCDQDAQAIWQ
jgi:hypothetical protein